MKPESRNLYGKVDLEKLSITCRPRSELLAVAVEPILAAHIHMVFHDQVHGATQGVRGERYTRLSGQPTYLEVLVFPRRSHVHTHPIWKDFDYALILTVQMISTIRLCLRC